MSHHKIEYDEACKSCKATGLYVGMAERDGAAVVCHTCKGTGKHHVVIEYDDFEGRVIRDDVARVYQVNPGIVIGTRQKYAPDLNLADFGGMPYEEWQAGKEFPEKSENRAYTCPAWWYQSADYDKKPEWKECLGCVAFSSCRNFPNKARCWERFDAENNS